MSSMGSTSSLLTGCPLCKDPSIFPQSCFLNSFQMVQLSVLDSTTLEGSLLIASSWAGMCRTRSLSDVMGEGALGGTGWGVCPSPSSSASVWTFLAACGRVVLGVGFGRPALALVVRVVVRVDVLEGGSVDRGLVGGGLVEGGFFDTGPA